jgi:hypothetical protein
MIDIERKVADFRLFCELPVLHQKLGNMQIFAFDFIFISVIWDIILSFKDLEA